MAASSVLRARLTKINEEMHALQSRLQLLAIEHEQITDDLNSIGYLVLDLPAEITSKIFSHYVLAPRLGCSPDFTASCGPLTLAAVCQSWRDICFSTPCLWASLQIYPSKSWVEDHLDLLACWLRHAKNHPLDLDVFGCAGGSTMAMKAFSVVSHHSPQLRTLTFFLYAPFSFPDDEIRGRLPLLTELEVNIIAEQPVNPVIITAFREAPRLREVRLSGASLLWISLPWTQLTQLTFKKESDYNCFQILKETPNLEVLDVSLSGTGPPPLLSSQHTLPRLHTLIFNDPVGKLLERLVLPALQTAHLSALLGGVSSFIELGVRSAWPLRSIQIGTLVAKLANCIACLQSLPSLTRVHIECFRLTRSNLDELAMLLHQDRMMVPALETLILECCVAGFEWLRLREMLLSRLSGTQAKLRVFKLGFWRPVASKEEIYSELRPAMDAGLEISISVPGLDLR
ncbi:hypothetical protein C8R45DRAFT_552524 [Mycena sanguinolenta]|nr:hypothetical protein C8R45DRAFT_552524 [Mycena sanguinolenta]